MIVYVNGRGMNAPELKAYISELEAALKRYESENKELTEKLDELGRLYNIERKQAVIGADNGGGLRMAEYISREEAIKELREVYENEYPTASGDFDEYASHDVPNVLRNMKAADVQPVKSCRMIPLEPDCRGYTDVFICTNCHQHIHLGFIRKEYSGSFCIECGAEVKEDS